VGNFGSSTTTRIFNVLQSIGNFSDFQTYLVSETILNSLPSAPTPKITIDNGTNYYELVVTPGLSAKKLEFYNIPSSFFQAGFTIGNFSGATLASPGNSIFIVSL